MDNVASRKPNDLCDLAHVYWVGSVLYIDPAPPGMITDI